MEVTILQLKLSRQYQWVYHGQ